MAAAERAGTEQRPGVGDDAASITTAAPATSGNNVTASPRSNATATTATATDSDTATQRDEVEEEQDSPEERARKIREAADEGHDADIPTGIGYVLDDAGELKRQKSIADQKSLARTKSHASRPGADVEKTAGLFRRKSNATRGGGGGGEAKDLDDGDELGADVNIVWWDGDDDPGNPYNWPRWKKYINCTLISLLTFLTPLVSSIFAPGVPTLMAEFGSSNEELASFVVSVYVLGFAFGPLVLAPMSEIYGRAYIYHICNVAFICCVVGCARAPTLDSLIGLRFLTGVFGSCPVTNGGGTIADLIVQERRGAAMAVFSVGPLLGPIIGPVAGGFLAGAKGWRWVFWVVAIVSGALTIAMMFFLRETYAPVLMQRKVERLRKETGNDLLRSKLDVGLTPSDYFKRGIIRPLKMLFRSPICAIFALYMAVVYGYLYLMFTSVTEVFQQNYGFTTSTVGLVYLGLGCGSMIGLLFFSLTSDRYIQRMAKKEGQGLKPEYRLQLLPIGAVTMPAGFFIYGWTAQYHVHWMAPIVGMVFVGFGNLICFMSLQLYLVDCFSRYAASALAANTVVRSIAGAVLPLAGLRMYRVMGLGWGNSLLGFIAVALIPLPFFIMKFGEYLRKTFELKNL